jgi:thymidylate synthase (FAD)
LHDHARSVYRARLDLGVAREQARKDLPLSTYTEAYWKIDLHNLLHFLSLRLDPHAQQEIRSYANVIGYEVTSRWCPLVWEAFLEYQLNGLQLSQIELRVIQAINRGQTTDTIDIVKSAGLLIEEDGEVKPSRERSEMERKLELLGLPVPWRADK